MRQVVLDTETTGLEHSDGHRIIEIGCVEVIDRVITKRNFHQYIQPNRKVDEEAVGVHGITNEFLNGKPQFEEVMQAFLDFVDGSELVIHNAPFDIGFLNAELLRAGYGKKMADHCGVVDTLAMAREMYPGQRNTLDAICRRLEINNSHRTLHGALLDSEILADVYLLMTGGQKDLILGGADDEESTAELELSDLNLGSAPLRIVRANAAELADHEVWMEKLVKESGAGCVWHKSE